MDRSKRRLLKTIPKKRLLLSFLSASVFGRFIVDDRRKRIKKFAFSYENELVGTGENKGRKRVRRKFCFVLFGMKTDTDI